MDERCKAIDQVDAKGKGNIWLGGDFNLPKVNLSDQQILPGNPNAKITSSLITCSNDHSLTQVVELSTRKANTLDLFFTTNPSLINRVTTAPPLKDADHDMVFIDINTRAAIPILTGKDITICLQQS